MAILNVIEFPDSRLRSKCTEVTGFDKQLSALAQDMLETMYDAPGVGLAAIQVGHPIRMFVLDCQYSISGDEDDTESPREYLNKSPLVIVNPHILPQGGEVLFREGCLSVPGVYEDVKRYEKIHLKYQDLKGKACELEANGLLAIALQHETDHLDGRLFIDRLSVAKRTMAKSKMAKHKASSSKRSRLHVEL
jgi:peptide deformylase